MIELLVEHSLGFAQLQDGGRFGVRHIGITQGGALAWVAMTDSPTAHQGSERPARKYPSTASVFFERFSPS